MANLIVSPTMRIRKDALGPLPSPCQPRLPILDFWAIDSLKIFNIIKAPIYNF
jgi:phage terminase Nu1 subunit (DNA packaging protein)